MFCVLINSERKERAMTLEKVFEPMKIGSLEIKNRFIVSAMVMNCCTEDGKATEQFIAYHETKAKGGWGLIVTEDYAVDPTAKTYEHIPGLWCDEQIESHRALTDRVHAAGGKIFAQLFHGGRQTQRWIIGTDPVAPSRIPCPVKKDMPRELTTEEVDEMIEKFGDAALRAKQAGFDGVQIHGAHGYLITEFTSYYSNKRTDKYGGPLINRLRFPVEIIKNIKKKCSKDFPVDYKISGEERVEGGLNIEDTKSIVPFLVEAGIDSLNVSVGVYESWYTQVPPAVMGHGWISDYAAAIKSVVDTIPVTTVGRVNDPFVAEAIIKSGKADACYMGRASLADPDLPNKAKAGDFADIIRCVGCLQGCAGKIDTGFTGQCMLNPRTDREFERRIVKTDKPQKVFIAGGGPAGAECAIVAAQRGHDVELFEKEDRLGGMFYLAAIPPWKGEIASFINWQAQRMERDGVKVHLNTGLTKEIVEKEKPDVVVIAMGSRPFVPPIEGNDRPFVYAATDALLGKYDVNGNIAVIGGGQVGGETANFFATHGNSVTIIEMLPEILKEEVDNWKKFLVESLNEHGVKVYTDTSVKKICEDGTILASKDGKDIDLGKFDYVLMASGMRPVKGLEEDIKDLGCKLVFVGDSEGKSGNAMRAIENGYLAGMEI